MLVLKGLKNKKMSSLGACTWEIWDTFSWQ
jgi:hypothetical protein